MGETDWKYTPYFKNDNTEVQWGGEGFNMGLGGRLFETISKAGIIYMTKLYGYDRMTIV